MGLETNFGVENSFGNTNQIPKYLEDLIDDSILQDFVEIRHITPEDRNHEMYKAIKFSFKVGHIEILYERKVISSDKESIVIPHEQFLFGFRP
ncbi:MAG: hypothetical protein ACTSXK_03650, partial [Promethearchaeota archaeon]